METKPYVGITGFKTIKEIVEVTNQFLNNAILLPPPKPQEWGYRLDDHTAMMGILCSAKRMNDMTKAGKQSPAAKDISKLAAAAHPKSMPTIHYFTKNKDGLAEEVKRVFNMDGLYEKSLCRALQINMAWPVPEHVRNIREEFPDLSIILQVPTHAMGEIERVKEYSGLVQYCLVDPSGGIGKEMKDEHLSMAEYVSENIRGAIVGIAGGLSGDNVYEFVGQMYQRLEKHFSIDAQGQLRSKGCLDMEKTKEYITQAKLAIRIGTKFFI